ncbi:MAG TPA: TolC family protein [Candidatus Sulfotelmatobacter sp.]|nr:TolC family protein [Candidatus Sulfotelmatobacter sp.]
MRYSRLFLAAFHLSVLIAPLWAQKGESYGALMRPQVQSGALNTPNGLRTYVVDGKLRLSLRDAVVLTIENNSAVRVQETQIETSKFALLGAHAPFDPLITSTDNITGSISPPFAFLQGIGGNSFNTNFKNTSKNLQVNYSQSFQTGTNVQTGLLTNIDSTNISLGFFNPFTSSTLTFQFTQPLLRNGWLPANRAALLIARRNLEQSRASFAAEVNNSILQAVAQYWAVVQARGNLTVARSSMEAAEATYKHDKRSLELGALPPLDIFRSESQVASRRVQVIQSEYALKQAEDALRLTIGADQDPYFQALDLELTEQAEPASELRTIDTGTALQTALTKRPEFDAARAALARDETQIRLAHNHLLPQLDLTGLYASNGLGGAGFNLQGQPISSSWVSQMFSFNYPTYEAQLTLSLPLKNRAAKAEMGTALVGRRNDLYSQRQIREQVTLDVSNAVHQLEQAKLSIVAGKEALDLAKKTMAAEQRKYELGSGTIFLVLEAQSEVAAADQTLLQAEVGYQLAVAAIDHATGELLEPYHVQIADLTK